MTGELVQVARLQEIRPGQMLALTVEGLPIALASVDGVLYAFSDTCRHEGGPLACGALIGSTVTCPWHGWTYDIRTGKSVIPPVGLRIPTYPVHIKGDAVYIEIEWE
jgi:nitrite reductase (NADH) small subunit/3-phenylpropionate/trans-cinnamate dioxygenase ferredoxin subunit